MVSAYESETLSPGVWCVSARDRECHCSLNRVVKISSTGDGHHMLSVVSRHTQPARARDIAACRSRQPAGPRCSGTPPRAPRRWQVAHQVQVAGRRVHARAPSRGRGARRAGGEAAHGTRAVFSEISLALVSALLSDVSESEFICRILPSASLSLSLKLATHHTGSPPL